MTEAVILVAAMHTRRRHLGRALWHRAERAAAIAAATLSSASLVELQINLPRIGGSQAGSRLFKIAHLDGSPTQIILIDLADSREIWNLRSTGVFPIGAACLPVKVAHAFVGVHNEHFLHNRSRGRGDHSCRILGTAPLNSAF
jgi:hypothetical protein